jgi:hypothetical protein
MGLKVGPADCLACAFGLGDRLVGSKAEGPPDGDGSRNLLVAGFQADRIDLQGPGIADLWVLAWWGALRDRAVT